MATLRLGWLLGGLLLVSCKGEAGPPDASYEVRGRVVEVTGSGKDVRATIAHDEIANFRDREGRVTGMPAMSMAFGLAERVDPKSLKPGQSYQLTFDVRWKQEPTLVITAAQPVDNPAP
jgi:hypothetical protein